MSVLNFEAPPQRAPWAKARILETADFLFYSDGLRSVGVDRLIKESGVTKATFYKHYGSKDRLILAYITARQKAEREQLETIAERSTSPEHAIRAIVAAVAADVARPDFRGCAFINAAAEFPDATDPVRLVVTRHRDWYTGFLAELMQDHGHRMPGDAADELMLARDGAMSGGYAGDPIAAAAALGRVADRVIRAATEAA